MNSLLDLTIVMPVFNEAECLEQEVTLWVKATEKLKINFKLIIVDDGSTDGSNKLADQMAERLKNVEVIHQTNAGHGAAVLHGYLRAIDWKTQWVFQIDSDGQISPDKLPLTWSLRDQSAVILGHRVQRQDPWIRRLVSKISASILRLIFRAKIPDPNVPFRLMSSSFLKQAIPLIPKGMFAPNLALSLLAARKSRKLPLIPVDHVARRTGEVSIASWGLLRACLLTLSQLMKLRLNLWCGLHKK